MPKKAEMDFALRVRTVVANIPKGTVMTYASVAKKAGFPGAARAVGSVMKHNTSKSVPCHRVVRSDGHLGEYNGLVGRSKALLLKKEGVEIVSGRVVLKQK